MTSKLDSRETTGKLDEFVCVPNDDGDREMVAIAEAIVDEEDHKEGGRFDVSVVEDGRPLAIFSYFSVMFGIPVFIVPLVIADNEFSLHHGKAAGVIYLACTAMLIAAIVNSAMFLPFVFLCYIPALVGIYRASAGVEAGTTALGPAGERIFRSIEVKE